MDPNGYHLAELNVAVLSAPIDSPQLAAFVDALGPVNALADSSPGFVWRLQTDDGDATAIRAFDDDRIIVNMSVWESLAALRAFVSEPAHREILRRRREFFELPVEAYLALWWIPIGSIPTVADAKDRIGRIRTCGPTDYAFDFRHTFPAPGAGAAGAGAA
jgi:heme-degrading monooxygenase HmoA